MDFLELQKSLPIRQKEPKEAILTPKKASIGYGFFPKKIQMTFFFSFSFSFSDKYKAQAFGRLCAYGVLLGFGRKHHLAMRNSLDR